MQFRTKARAVDLLGKGQIADLPTAIIELWKNGYDAYADNLTAEIFQKEYADLENDLFLLTDDGKGMSQSDILDKWLVLGTDSKSRALLEIKPDKETLWKKPRVKAGEKGIGRLSVAFLGNPMLMLTKRIGFPLQLLFFDWRLLENFNLYLDDINIPVASLTSESDFGKIFLQLKKEFLKNFDKKEDSEGNIIWEDNQEELKNEIINSVAKAKLSDKITNTLLNNFDNLKDSHGTKFLIFEPIDQILDLAKENQDDLRENRDFIISSLSGFFNPFILAKNEKNKVNTYFYIHQTLGKDKEIFNEEAKFFTKEDYDFADILIEGNFNGNGEFNGSLKIYDKVISYDYDSNRRKFKRKYYGNVFIKLGYSQGKLIDSKLSETAFKKINDKVTRNGGLYIYRDNFRVLPYGRPNADFLKFEERRNKRIGTYFFSYRRMFGYLGISRDENPELKDKSSREGLINNDPYSAFESDIIAFFIQVAKDYFSDKAEESIFLDEKKKLNEESQAIADDKKRETEEKKLFSRTLSAYPSRFKNYEKQYLSILNEIEKKISLANSTYNDIEDLLDELHKLDIEFESLLPEMPKRYKPTDLQLDRLNNYEEQIFAFNKNVKKSSIKVMKKVNEKLELHELKQAFTKNAEVYRSELESIVLEYSKRLKVKFQDTQKEYEDRSSNILSTYKIAENNAIEQIVTKKDIAEQSRALKLFFDQRKDELNKTLIPFIEHIEKMNFDIDEELLQGAYKARYDQMLQQWSMIQETAQLGIAVEIIDHEFNVLYARINRLLEDLDGNNLFIENKQYLQLESTFRTLEDKYDLLSPLYRINGGSIKEIPGANVISYVKDFFGKQLSDDKIEITYSNSFFKHIILIKEPTLYTVIINIVNNAIYWMRNAERKEIRFDYLKNTQEILILNSGKKIEEHRLSKIFGLFHSNRPGGRGIGLYLAKESLNENYYDIEASNEQEYNYLGGACFIIKTLSK
ncbi:hypothetical protein DRF60_15045 [Chryseobacterium elymi]|uniref:Histidine kinase domain-containing protein n=1 Tax=Chryseobacterium elymi TaxID=395936 RepID=A0A3D9DCU5_9FLAO|nr:ATP-binding protein [Chryseobacterium elymi]REC75825.1 hypothetical protein DRF60_15045 [Chryseobacterium elymi]